MAQLTTKQALLIAAAAFIAQPFVSHAISNWDTYRSDADAWEACNNYADRVGKEVTLTVKGEGYTGTGGSNFTSAAFFRARGGEITRHSHRCIKVAGDAYRVVSVEYTVDNASESAIDKGERMTTIKNFYF